MININTNKVIFKMSKENEPAAYCKSGDIITFHTLDCFCNKLLPKGAKFGVDNQPFSNPATGPLFIRDAMPGDTLKVEIIDIIVGKVGISTVGPYIECFKNKLSDFELRRTPVENGVAKSSNNLSIPTKPMIGVIGVAPSDNAVSTGLPGNHGGNMDCSQIKKGAILYLPILAEGALLAIGDIHALMGDGEISECGLEIEGNATIRVSVLKEKKQAAPAVYADGKWITIATCKTLEEAADEAASMMLNFLIEEAGIEANDAGTIVSLCGNLIICQKCNVCKTVRMELALDSFTHRGNMLNWHKK